MDHFHIKEIKNLIESPIASDMNINIFLREWENVKKREIESLTCKAYLQLEHAQYQNIEYFLDVFCKWQSALGKSKNNIFVIPTSVRYLLFMYV